uniref:Protein RFT1 homolog n=1 Tax=Strongyloides papillosus TaxID=174720 RepID=A0A0N5C4Q4_STREA
MDSTLKITSWCCVLSNLQFLFYMIVYKRKYTISTENLWLICIQFFDFLRGTALISYNVLTSPIPVDFKKLLEANSFGILGLFQEEITSSFKFGIWQSLVVNRYGNWKIKSDDNFVEASNELVYTLCILLGPTAQFIYLSNLFPFAFQKISDYDKEPFSLQELNSLILTSKIRFGSLLLSSVMLVFICLLFNFIGNDVNNNDVYERKKNKSFKANKYNYYEEKSEDNQEDISTSRMSKKGFKAYFLTFLFLTFMFEIILPLYVYFFIPIKNTIFISWITRNLDNIRSIITSLIFRHSMKYYKVRIEEDN